MRWMSERSKEEAFDDPITPARAWRYGDPEPEVKETKPGTVAKPTKTSCLLGSEIPETEGGREPDLVIRGVIRLLESRPRQASMKKSFGLPSRDRTSLTYR